MTEIATSTNEGTEASLAREAVDGFAGSLSGELIRPADDAYGPAREIWNGMIDKHPALIARCAGADDVAASVRFARDNDLLVSVRGGGHGVAEPLPLERERRAAILTASARSAVWPVSPHREIGMAERSS